LGASVGKGEVCPGSARKRGPFKGDLRTSLEKKRDRGGRRAHGSITGSFPREKRGIRGKKTQLEEPAKGAARRGREGSSMGWGNSFRGVDPVKGKGVRGS